jgi:enoyl-CoA hydratase
VTTNLSTEMTATVFRSAPADNVALLTLENPRKLGALDHRMREQLTAHWLDIRGDSSVLAVVLTGSGRGFSTGLDLEAANVGHDPATEFQSAIDLPRLGLGPIENGVWKPFIVAINGVCAGGGFHLLTDADIILASDDATFLDPHVSVGQVSALEPIELSRRMPLGSVLRMLVLGRHEPLTAAEALRLGLVSEVVEPDRLLARAIELASMAAQGSPAAIERSKRAVWGSLQLGLDAALQAGWDQIRAHWDHPDFREGIAAYVEQRAPSWATSTVVEQTSSPTIERQ